MSVIFLVTSSTTICPNLEGQCDVENFEPGEAATFPFLLLNANFAVRVQATNCRCNLRLHRAGTLVQQRAIILAVEVLAVDFAGWGNLFPKARQRRLIRLSQAGLDVVVRLEWRTCGFDALGDVPLGLRPVIRGEAEYRFERKMPIKASI